MSNGQNDNNQFRYIVAKDVPFAARMKARWAGYRDGSKGLVQKLADGKITSFYIESKTSITEATIAANVKVLENLLKPPLVREAELVKAIELQIDKIDEAKTAYQKADSDYGANFAATKKPGEEQTDAYVARKRRAAERKQAFGPLIAAETEAKQMLEALEVELEKVRTEIRQEENKTIQLIDQIKSRNDSEVYIYLCAASRKNPQLFQPPYSLPAITLPEEMYAGRHDSSAAVTVRKELCNA